MSNSVITLYNIINYGNLPITRTQKGFSIKTPKEFVEIIAEPGLVTYKINGQDVATTHSTVIGNTPQAKDQVNDLLILFGQIVTRYMKQNLK